MFHRDHAGSAEIINDFGSQQFCEVLMKTIALNSLVEKMQWGRRELQRAP